MTSTAYLYGTMRAWNLMNAEELAIQISIGGVAAIPLNLNRRRDRIEEAMELMRIEATWERNDAPAQILERELEPLLLRDIQTIKEQRA